MKNLKKFVCNLDVIISGLSLCAIVVITLAGVIMRKIMYQLMSSVTKKVTPYFKINYAFIDVAAPIGMILMAIQYIVYTYRHLKGLGNPGDDQKALLKGEEE